MDKEAEKLNAKKLILNMLGKGKDLATNPEVRRKAIDFGIPAVAGGAAYATTRTPFSEAKGIEMVDPSAAGRGVGAAILAAYQQHSLVVAQCSPESQPTQATEETGTAADTPQQSLSPCLVPHRHPHCYVQSPRRVGRWRSSTSSRYSACAAGNSKGDSPTGGQNSANQRLPVVCS